MCVCERERESSNISVSKENASRREISAGVRIGSDQRMHL